MTFREEIKTYEAAFIARVSMPVLTPALDYFSITIDELHDGKKWPVIQIRQIIQYLLKKYTDLSLEQIGEITAKDHSTVIYNVQKIQRIIEGNRINEWIYKVMIHEIESRINLTK